MSVAVYNHYKRLYNNLPSNTTNKSQQNSPESLNNLITNLPNQQQQRKFQTNKQHLFTLLFRFYS